MAKTKQPKWKKKVGFFVLTRNYTAVIATWLMNLNMFGLSFKKICTPGFNCHGCPWATSACPVGVATFGSALHVLPAFAIATILAVGALAGRLVCAFACPFGFFQELMHRIPGPKFKLPGFARYGKYVALVLLVIILPYWLGFEQDGYLRIDTAEFTDPADAEDEEEMTDEEYEKWLESQDEDDEEDEEDEDQPDPVRVTVTVTNLGEKPVIDPTINVIRHVRPEAKGGALGAEVDRLPQAFAGVVIAPGETVKLKGFDIPDTREEQVLFIDSPEARVEQHPRHDLYYCKVCPIGGLEATIPRLVADTETGWGTKLADNWLKLSITALFLGLMVFTSRPFCRMFCPLGATYALGSKLAISGMTFKKENCGGCGVCIKVCPVDIDPTKEVGGMDCILCGDCIQVCPRGAIQRTFGFKYEPPDFRDFDLKGKKKPKAAAAAK